MPNLFPRTGYAYALTALFLLGALQAPGREPALGQPAASGERWERRILQSYGWDAAVEPGISEVERALLEKIESLMQDNAYFALKMAEDIVLASPVTNAQFNQLLGTLYLEEALPAEALVQFETAVKKYPAFRRAWNSLGSLRYARNEYAEAVEALSKAIQLGTVDPYTYGMLAYSHLELENFEAAAAAYGMALLFEPDNPDWIEGQVQVLRARGKTEEAVGLLDELIRIRPGELDYWLAQAESYLARGDRLRAARNLEIARVLGDTTPKTLVLLGSIYLQENIQERAAQAFLIVLDSGDPLPPPLALNASRQFLSRGEIPLARRLLDSVTAQKAGSLGLREKAAVALLEAEMEEQAGRRDAALEILRRAESEAPLEGELLVKLARWEAEAGRQPVALLLLERLPADSVYQFPSLLLRARYLAELQRYPEAMTVLEQALKLQPTQALANLYAQVLEAMKARG